MFHRSFDDDSIIRDEILKTIQTYPDDNDDNQKDNDENNGLDILDEG